MAGSGIKAKVLGGFLSSKRLLRDNIWMIKATITGRKTIGIVAMILLKYFGWIVDYLHQHCWWEGWVINTRSSEENLKNICMGQLKKNKYSKKYWLYVITKV